MQLSLKFIYNVKQQHGSHAKAMFIFRFRSHNQSSTEIRYAIFCMESRYKHGYKFCVKQFLTV